MYIRENLGLSTVNLDSPTESSGDEHVRRGFRVSEALNLQIIA
jgi:hypothetical protein